MRVRTLAAMGMAVMVALGSVPAPVKAVDLKAGLGAGVFQPWEGDLGFSVLGHTLFALTENWDLGPEIEYRQFDADFVGSDNVTIRTVAIRALTRYSFELPVVRPYLGAGIGIDFNIWDGDEVQQQTINDFATGIGFLGLAGLDVPLGDLVILFAEFRAGYDLQLSSDENLDAIDANNLGGYQGVAGVRLAF